MSMHRESPLVDCPDPEYSRTWEAHLLPHAHGHLPFGRGNLPGGLHPGHLYLRLEVRSDVVYVRGQFD